MCVNFSNIYCIGACTCTCIYLHVCVKLKSLSSILLYVIKYVLVIFVGAMEMMLVLLKETRFYHLYQTPSSVSLLLSLSCLQLIPSSGFYGSSVIMFRLI